MARYISVEEARSIDGLRLVVTAHVPGLWSEALKSLFDVKRVPYVLVEQVIGGENRALAVWTAQTSAPVAIWNDERPRTTWLEQLCLAERLAPAPALIPDDLDDRLLMVGLAHEICGENGFGWNVRLRSVHRALSDPDADALARSVSPVLARKYGYAPDRIGPAERQMHALVARLRRQLDEQQRRGRRFLIGDALSALDVYWAVFAGAIDPLPEADCPGMSATMRASYTDPVLRAAAGDALMAHRDAVFRDHLRLPMDF